MRSGMEGLVEDFLSQKRFAVAGSFRDESKFAYRIVVDLLEKGYEVFPVNPRVKDVKGRPCYRSVSDIPVDVDVADLVTPPDVTEMILEECLKKGIKRVWLQPGAESEAAISFCRANGIKVIYGLCVMRETAQKNFGRGR